MYLMAKENGIEYNSAGYVPGSGVRAGALLQGRTDAVWFHANSGRQKKISQLDSTSTNQTTFVVSGRKS